MRRSVVAAGLAAVVALAVVAMPLHLRSWTSFDLPDLAQGEVRHRLPASEAPIFLDQGDGRTTVHETGRSDLRAVCGWMTTRDSGDAPRFFYVLYGLGLTSVSADDVFIQSRADEASPKGGEVWCRSPALPSA